MLKQSHFKYVWFIVLIFIGACSPRSIDDGLDASSSEPLLTSTNRASEFTAVPTTTLDVTPTQAVETTKHVASPLPTTIQTPTQSTVLQSECPTTLQSLRPLWTRGSVLIETGEVVDDTRPSIVYPHSGIWAISASSTTPYLISNSFMGERISPDGALLLNTIRDTERSLQEVILYDLIEAREYTRWSLPASSSFQTWLQDGRIRFREVINRTENVGIVQNIYTLNTVTQEIERREEKLSLPDFAFNDSELDKGIFQGYESIDPTGELILYTAHKNGGNGFEVRLFDFKTNEVIWRHETQYLPDSTPKWSSNGERVLFSVNVPLANNNSWWKIISLSRDGREVKLPSQPLPFTEGGQLNHYSQSPDGRYLFYTIWEINSETFTGNSRAFIINVATEELKEICEPGTTFLSPVPAHGNEAGQWLLDNKLVYRVLLEKEGQLTHSLRVLDILTWAVQNIHEPASGEGVIVIGWTSVEFP